MFPVILQIQHFYKFKNFSNQSWLFYMAALGLFGLYFFRDKKPIQKLSDDEYDEVSWSEYWERYEKEESLIADIFSWLFVLLPFLIFMYGFYQNETVYLWSKYAVITLQIIGILFLISVPTHGIIKLISNDKILNIVSLIVNLIIMIVGIYTGDWILAIVMFAGFMIFMNKVFA